VRAAVVAQRDRLAVEDERAGGQRADRFDDLGDGVTSRRPRE